MKTVAASAVQEGCERMDELKEAMAKIKIPLELTELAELVAQSANTDIDNVNHPQHYETGKYECIDVMVEAIGLEDTKGFCLCNAFKYIYRCTKKHNTPVEDVKKAIWYLNKFLELEG